MTGNSGRVPSYGSAQKVVAPPQAQTVLSAANVTQNALWLPVDNLHSSSLVHPQGTVEVPQRVGPPLSGWKHLAAPSHVDSASSQ